MASAKLQELDFIKGVAIFSVILLHTLKKESLFETYAFFHIWQAVPLFIMVSFYLLFRKMDRISIQSYYSPKEFIKLIKRVIIPFVIIELALVIIILITNGTSLAINVICRGGIGPGAYYPYIYVQIWLLTPLLYTVLVKYKIGGVIILLFNVIFNIVAYEFIQNDRVYSFLFIRYMYISVLAYIWYRNRKNVKYWIILSCLSIAYYFSCINGIDFTPWLDKRWGMQQIPAFFYMFSLFWGLHIFHSMYKSKWILLFEWMGKNSYEIFLSQIFWLSLISQKMFSSLGNSYMNCIIFIFAGFLLSIGSVYLYQYFINNEKFGYNSCPRRQ